MIIGLSVLSSAANAGELDVPNQFQAGTPAVAAEVNENFAAVEAAVDGNAQDIAANTTDLAANTAAIEGLQVGLLTAVSLGSADIVTVVSDTGYRLAIWTTGRVDPNFVEVELDAAPADIRPA